MTSNRKSEWLGYAFLFIMIGLFGSLISSALRKSEPVGLPVHAYQQLHAVYRNEGISRFLEEKARLKSTVQRTMEANQDPESINEATNIAVYLFPDVLPSDDLEREMAETEWVPLQNAIESAPGSFQSREQFEEMRAMIWNYESPSRTVPQLSLYARQAIRIYQDLSAP